MSSEVTDYINRFPEPVKEKLCEIRALVQMVVPDAIECISYGIPTYKKGKAIVHFGGFKKHVSIFPTASGVKAFEAELKKYKTSKGAIQFPADQKLPLNLIKKIVKFRVMEVG